MADMDSQETNSKVWLITGCSSGLGRQLVSAVLARGDKVVATARRLSSIDDLPHSSNLKRLELDVTSAEEVLRQIVQDASNSFGTIDVLVNNAGYVASGVIEELGYENRLHKEIKLTLTDQTIFAINSRPTRLAL